MFLAALVLATSAALAQGWKYRSYKEPAREKVCVQVMWRATEQEVVDMCGGAGCWYKGEPSLIVAPRPKDFNDSRAIYILGHELLHALGAEHD